MAPRLFATFSNLTALAWDRFEFLSFSPRDTISILVEQVREGRLLSGGRPRRWKVHPHHKGLRVTTVSNLTKAEAEDLLDWLEGQGVHDHQVGHIAGKGYTILPK
jgi:hypothetical protein